MRVDKWLWAARFFKSRSLAHEAVHGGKVHCNNHRIKASHSLKVGDELAITTEHAKYTIKVLLLSDERKGADYARKLYEETKESKEKRSLLKANQAVIKSTNKPNKKERRIQIKFKRK